MPVCIFHGVLGNRATRMSAVLFSFAVLNLFYGFPTRAGRHKMTYCC